jgi:cell division septation protein DedD
MLKGWIGILLIAPLLFVSCGGKKTPGEKAEAPAVREAAPETTAEKPQETEKLVKAEGLPGVPGGYTIQLGAFRDKYVAQNIASQMIARGYKAYVQKAQVSGIGLVYRVRVGAYSSQDKARSVKREILSRYTMDGWIDHYVPPGDTPASVS